MLLGGSALARQYARRARLLAVTSLARTVHQGRGGTFTIVEIVKY